MEGLNEPFVIDEEEGFVINEEEVELEQVIYFKSMPDQELFDLADESIIFIIKTEDPQWYHDIYLRFKRRLIYYNQLFDLLLDPENANEAIQLIEDRHLDLDMVNPRTGLSILGTAYYSINIPMVDYLIGHGASIAPIEDSLMMNSNENPQALEWFFQGLEHYPPSRIRQIQHMLFTDTDPDALHLRPFYDAIRREWSREWRATSQSLDRSMGSYRSYDPKLVDLITSYADLNVPE
jgi:hypothetical protein